VNTIHYFTYTIQDAYKGISHNTLVIQRAAFFGSFFVLSCFMWLSTCDDK